MKGALLWTAVAALLMLGIDRLMPSDSSSVDRQDYLQRLAPFDADEPPSIAGLSFVDQKGGQEHFYLQQEGQWRCASVYGAVALAPEVQALIADLLQARGEEVAPASRASEYGIGEDRGWLLRLHGPEFATREDRDLLFEVRLGFSLSGLGEGRSFAHLPAAEQVLEIDRNPGSKLQQEEGKRLPPLLDKRLLAGEWPERGEGLARAFIDYTDGRSIELNSRVIGAAPAPHLPAPREWLAIEGERRVPCLPYRIGAWQSFLYHVPYLGLSDPGAAERRGLDEPVAKLTLIQVQGDPIELRIGRSAPSGATFVLNSKTGMLCLLNREEIDLLLVSLESLGSAERSNPWEAWLPK